MLFKDLDLGLDDAKGDARLSEYFIRTPEYDRVRCGKAAFVIGRKGTGKTAICQMIHEEAQHSPTMFSALLSFKNAPSNAIFQSNDDAFDSPNQYISIWKFLIAYESAKLILRDESVDSETKEELTNFLQTNFGTSEVGTIDAVSILKQRSWRVSLKLPLKFVDVPGGEIVRSSSDAGDQHIHFGRAAAALIDRIALVCSSNTFFVFFDELDEDYRIENRYFDLIISLLKATYQIRCEIPPTLALRPVVVLREDIFSQLDDHDLNKLDDLIVNLRWQRDFTTHERGLRGLINQRFRSNLPEVEQRSANDLWVRFVDESSWKGPYESAWKFLILRTMARPRDIIKALKCCQPFEETGRLGPAAINASLRDYSEWLSKEIGNEVFRALPEYRDVFSLITKIATPTIKAAVWRQSFGEKTELAKKYDADAVLKQLYALGVIGMIVGKHTTNWIFTFTHPQVTFDITEKLVLHPGFFQFRRDHDQPVLLKKGSMPWQAFQPAPQEYIRPKKKRSAQNKQQQTKSKGKKKKKKTKRKRMFRLPRLPSPQLLNPVH